MLEPRDRRLLFDLFRPPDGFQLDSAIGTTYSLDLLTLLVTPLAFTRFDWEAKDGRITSSPIAVLESLRRYADRITVFHQAGGLQAPTRHRLLFGYLEQSLVPVTSRTPPGVFHPKVWVLRFVPREGERRPSVTARYRLVCSSRNLTFDRSWDVVLTLEGEYAARSRRLPENRPLKSFLQGLPSLAHGDVSPIVRQRITTISDEIERVPFECPVGFDGLRFWSLVPGEAKPPFLRETVDRLLVVSPFLSDGLIGTIAGLAGKATLVSRTEELDTLADSTLDALDEVLALDAGAEIAPESAGDSQEPVEIAEPFGAPLNQDPTLTNGSAELSGLHAKIFVTESGKRARVWMGSANATDAAYNLNVEFLVELQGPVRECGIDTFLDPDRQAGFAALLQEYVRTGPPPTPTETPEERLRRQFDHVQGQIAMLPLRAEVTELPEPGFYDLRLVSEPRVSTPRLPHVTIRCRPLSLGDAWYREFGDGESEIGFSRLLLESITSFFVFEMTGVVQVDGHDQRLARLFLLNVPLIGAPSDRKERLLVSLLRDKHQILRYLLLLLSDEGWDARRSILSFDEPSDPAHNNRAGAGDQFDLPLLEALVLSLARHPEKLDPFQRVIADLKETPEGTTILPDGLLEVWEPIWRVRQERRNVPAQ